MAKKKEKTLEEKLQEALVPENQWPYMLPENWCWTRLDFIANYKKGPFGSSLTKAMFVPKGKNTYKVYEQGNAINKSTQYGSYYITKEKYDSMDGFSVEPNDIIVSCAGTIGEIFRLPQNIEKGIINQALMRVRLNSSVVYQIFEYYFSNILIQNITDESNGTAIKNIPPFKVLKQMPFPLPPLPEQKRIVHRIESLFAKLDEAKEKIQQVLDGAEMRKAAILHKAFTGELTKNWRKENNITTTADVNREKLSKECEEYDIPYEIPDEWRWVTFNEVCTFIGSGVTPKGGQAVYTDSGIPFIRSQNVLNGRLDLSDVAYISDEINEKMKRTQIIGGETLLNITGASIGRSCYVPQEQSVGNVNQHVCILRFKKYINGYIPQLWLNSPKMQEFINFNQVGQTRQALNFKQIRGIYFPLPPLQEQLEMVRIIKYEINKLDVVCNSLTNLAVRIDTMKKSILAKAFRGELGTNNPTEDSALNLLKEVLQDKS